MKKRNIFIVDANNLTWAAFHSYRSLTHKGRSVAIIYGLPSMIKALLTFKSPDKIYLVWDGGHDENRVKALPDYKKRDKLDPKMYESFITQKAVVQELFYYLGVPQVVKAGMEADDYIYMMTRRIRKNKKNLITIVSGDKDFHQMLNPRVKIYRPTKKDEITHENCEQIFGYTPSQCVDYLSLVGDKSDNIPGYPKIGDKKAKEILSAYGHIPKALSELQEGKAINPKFITYKELKRVYIQGLKLISLSYHYNKHLRTDKVSFYKNESKPKPNKEKFFEVCQNYNMKKLLNEPFFKAFKQLCE